MEAPLADYETRGDFNKPGPFRGPDKKLVIHPKNIEKTRKFFQKSDIDFRLFFIQESGIGKYSEHGQADEKTLRTMFSDQLVDSILDNHENAITIVYVGNKGDQKVPMTPWIMAHRFGHAIIKSTNVSSGYAWTEMTKFFVREIENILQECYGFEHYITVSSLGGKHRLLFRSLFNQLGTQRSSRQGNIDRPYEFFYEMLAQFIGTGKVTFNAFPKEISWGNVYGKPTQRLIARKCSDEDLAYYAQRLSNDVSIMIDDVLSASVGYIFVM